jgi:hypothetical protein
MAATKITLENGLVVRTATVRCYVVIATRSPLSPEAARGVFATVILRTDNLATAQRKVRSYGWSWGAHAEIYDRRTGQRVPHEQLGPQ